jgi:lipopolysaccharide transport system ATP-binding protein
MRARLGFAIALEASPDVLLVDEVMGVGDESFRRKSSARMKERMGSDQTVVFASHSPASIRQLCNRVVWIEEGVTRQEGATHEVVADYHAWTKTEATRSPYTPRDNLQA